MEPLETLRDADLFENPVEEPKFYARRRTSKGIVLDDDGNVAFLSVRGHGLFPGGGVEKDESIEDALIRECKEEIGCSVIPILYLGQYDQYRALQAKKYEVYFFVAYVTGEKGSPTTKDSKELKCELSWGNKHDVHRFLKKQLESISLDEYALHFNARTHLSAFEKFLTLDNSQDGEQEVAALKNL